MALKKNFAKAYQNTAVESLVTEATPHKLVEMLYEGAIKNLKLAKIFIEQKNFEKKTEHLNKSLAIFTELKSGIDEASGKEVAENFSALYEYCYQTAVQANLHNDIAKIDEIIQLIDPILEAWKQMPEVFKKASRNKIDQMRGLNA